MKVKVNSLSHVPLFATPGTVAYQAPPSMGFSRQEYWCGLPWPPPRYLPSPGIEFESLLSLVLAGRFFTTIILHTSNYYTVPEECKAKFFFKLQ